MAAFLVFGDLIVQFGNVRIELLDCPTLVNSAHQVKTCVGSDFKPQFLMLIHDYIIYKPFKQAQT